MATIAPTPGPLRNRSLRFYPKRNTISILTQSPIQPLQFAIEQSNSRGRSSEANAIIDELTFGLSCYSKCHLVDQACLVPCAQHQYRRAFIAGVDGLTDHGNVQTTTDVVRNDAALDVSDHPGPDPDEANDGRHDGNIDNESNEGSSNYFGTGNIRSPTGNAGNAGNGNNEDSSSNYSNGNNHDANGSDGNGNNRDVGGDSGNTSNEGSSEGTGDNQQKGSGNGGSDEDESSEKDNPADSTDGEFTPVSDGSEDEILAERRRYYAIGQPMPRKATYAIPDPFLQRSGEYYARDFEQLKKKAKRDLPAPSQVQLSCVHKWSVEDGAKGCCQACGGWHGLYMFDCSTCKALSRACCTPRWTGVVKARSGLNAKRPDEILQPVEVEHRLAEEVRGFRKAAITEWQLVSKRGRYLETR